MIAATATRPAVVPAPVGVRAVVVDLRAAASILDQMTLVRAGLPIPADGRPVTPEEIARVLEVVRKLTARMAR